MTIDFPKFRKLLCHLRELLSGPCRIDYINGSDTFPPPPAPLPRISVPTPS